MRLLALFLSLTATACLAADSPKEVKGKVVAIADGDTLTVLDADKVQHNVRLHGIDAPEKGQDYGTKSMEALGKLVFEKEVTVAVKNVDRYKRLVGKVMVGGTDVNLKMVTDGWCWR